MSFDIHPLLGEAAGFGEAMNWVEFGVACTLAVAALLLCFLPERWRVVRWMTLALASVSIALVFHLSLPSFNNPPWQPLWVRALPVLVAAAAIVLSSRALAGSRIGNGREASPEDLE